MDHAKKQTYTSPRFTSAVAEFKKTKHQHTGLLPIAFLFITFFWCAFMFRDLSDYDRAQGYTRLFFQMPVINCIMMPVMLAVLASRLCDMEIKGGTLKLLYTMQESHTFYDLKFLHEVCYLLTFSALECLIFPLCGSLFGFTETLSLSLLLHHFAVVLVAGAVVLTVQHYLSLTSKNQIFPLLFGLIGSFMGMFSMFFPPAIANFVLWGYFGAFLPYFMEYDEAARLVNFYAVPFQTVKFALFTLCGILLYVICRSRFLKREV